MKNCPPLNLIEPHRDCEYSVGNLVRLASPPNRDVAKEKRNMGIITEIKTHLRSVHVKVLWPKIGVEEYWEPAALEVINEDGKLGPDSSQHFG